MNTSVRLLSALGLALVLQACGGGGGASPPKIGQFVDDPVEGLSYVCTGGGAAASPGVTNALGQFNYQPGQSCTFSVGKVIVGSLPSIPADGLVTPQDVAGVSRSATTSPAATAIAQFLQSLSEPGSDGKIKISAATTAALSNGPETKLIDTTGPIAQDSLRTLVTSLGKTLVSPAQAAANLATGNAKSGVSASGGLVTPGTPKAINSISVSAPAASQSALAAGDAIKLTAMANWSDGSGSVVDGTVSWSSSDTAVATVGSDGTVTSLKPGRVKISVSNNTFKGSLELTVTDAVLKSLDTASGMDADLPKGANRSLSLVGTYSDGTQKNLTSGLTWSVDDANKASVEQGVLLAKSPGEVNVTGSMGAVSKQFKLKVTPAVLRTLAISRADAQAIGTAVAAGRTVQLKAVGTYSDNSTLDMSDAVTWGASNDKIAVANGGLVTMRQSGTAEVTVSHGAPRISGLVSLTVGAAELSSLEISAPSSSLALGLNQTLALKGIYTDGSETTSLTGVQWTSSDATKASVATNGTFTTLAQGAVKVTAAVGSVTKEINLTVTEPVAKALTFSGVVNSIANGASVLIDAVATLTNNATVSVAKLVNWTIESLGGQAVYAIEGDNVRFTGTAAGDVLVKGGYQGIFANFRMSVTPVLMGSAAVGAPIANAKIYIVDSLGRTPTGQDESSGTALVTTDANGAYFVPSSVLSGLTGPFMLRVVGKMLTETGEMGPAVFHTVTQGVGATTANITPLTEAHAALVLGAQPALIYGNSSALSAVTTSTLAAANSELVAALAAVSDFSSSPNFVSDPLDATPGAAKDTNARKHDATLDQLAVSVSMGRITLIDRNQDESNFATGPRVEVVSSTRKATTPSGAVTAKVTPISLDRAKQFAARFTEKLAVQCDVEIEPTVPTPGLCDAVTNPVNNIFHAQFKDRGMSSWRWIRGWLSDAFETTDLTGVQVSVVSTTLGSFIADGGQRVHRILLRFSKGSDVVMRQMLVADDGTNVRAYGNQKDFFFYLSPRFNHKADASGLYPYYPKYEQGVSVMLRPWFGSQNDVIFGAHVAGPGFPSVRQANNLTVNGLTGGIDVNRNRLASGIEVFDRRSFGCSAFAIDPSVYVERNTLAWPSNGIPASNGGHRWRPDSTTCSPLFDFLRYDARRESSYTLPKKGDSYSVTLYLDAAKFAPNTSVPPPAGAGTAVNRTNSDGVTKSVLPYTFTYTLPSDAFPMPDSDFNPATYGFPGVTDSTRQNLAQLNVGDDLNIAWTRSKSVLSDGAVFGSFYAGRYMSSYDQWGTYQSTSTTFRYDDGSSSENYSSNRYLSEIEGNCGAISPNKFRNGSVVTIPLIRRGTSPNFTYTTSTCSARNSDLAAARTSDPNATIVYSNQRLRKQYVSDRGRLVATSDTSQVLRFSDLISRERDGNFNFCSAYTGFIRSRQVYVQLSDINGRQLMEMRDVWWDFPNKTPYPSANLSDRPNQTTDMVYLPNTSVGKTNYNGERGFVHATQTKQGAACVGKTW